MGPRAAFVAGGRLAAEEAAPAGEPAPLQWSRAMVDAVRRIDQFVVRYLDATRCGLWTVVDDGQRAICVDLFQRDGAAHRREADREGPAVAALHRRLEVAGIVATCAEQPTAGLLPPGASSVLAVALRRAGRLVAYLSAEQVGDARRWSADERRFVRSMAEVLGEVLAATDSAVAQVADALPFGQLPVVAYRGLRIDGEWTLTMVSEGSERVLGRRAAELIGAPVCMLRQLLADVPPALPAAGDFEHAYRRQRVDALHRYSETGHVRSDPDRGSAVVEGLIVELAGNGTLEEPLQQYELLLQVGHELRTPLNAILGFAQLLDVDAAAPEMQRREYLAQIQRAGHHLLDVIAELMDLTRLQAGKVELQPAPLSLARVVEDSLPMVSNQAAQAAVELHNDVRDPGVAVLADARSLQQALVNLLSNAVKYNRAGGSVHVACDAAGDAVRIRVADTGIGLSAEQTRSLFQPFNRLGMERSGIEGVGLGLVITRRLVEAMGGRIEVSSQRGAGSTFEITLPRAEA